MSYEIEIRKIISKKLKRKDAMSIDVNSNLCEIGMDSLSFIAIIVEVENKFGIEFSSEVLSITELNSISQISAHLSILMSSEN